MLDALGDVGDDRTAALVAFVDRVGPEEAAALRAALQTGPAPAAGMPPCPRCPSHASTGTNAPPTRDHRAHRWSAPLRFVSAQPQTDRPWPRCGWPCSPSCWPAPSPPRWPAPAGPRGCRAPRSCCGRPSRSPPCSPPWAARSPRPRSCCAPSAPQQRTGTPLLIAVAVAATIAGLIVLRLAVVLVLLGVRTRRRRARHRDMVDLLDRAERSATVGSPGARAVLRVLDGAVPFAYCVPGRAPRVVVTEAALDTLAPDELRAVLAHEQAHLDARHDLVRESFVALHQAFPMLVRSRQARDAVGLLLEMLADDAARTRSSDTAMAGALEAFVVTGDTEIAARLERVRDPALRRPPPRHRRLPHGGRGGRRADGRRRHPLALRRPGACPAAGPAT